MSAALVLISACSGSDAADTLVPVGNTNARSITLTPNVITFDAIGATEHDTATVIDKDGVLLPDAPVTWTSSSPSVDLALPTTVVGDRIIANAGTAVTGPAIVIIAAAQGNATVTATSGTATVQLHVTVTQVPSQISIVSGDRQTGTVGTALSNPLRVKVLDRLGNPIGGRAVTFSPAQGSVTPAIATTTADGIASATWTLGTAAGAQTVTVNPGGTAGTVTFTATAVPGAAAKVTLVSGANQSATINTNVSIPPSVRVTDQFDNPLAGVTVTFAVTAGGGSVTGATATTNSSGIATVGSWRLGPTTGTNTLTVTAAGVSGSLAINATATGAQGFTVQVQFLSSMTASQQAAFTNAALRWSTVITGDLPDAPLNAAAGQCGDNSPAINQTIDDVLIFATVGPIDGVGKILGNAGPCYIRGSNGLTVVGAMTFDEADLATLETNGLLGAVILHEMGHVLGIGTFWTNYGLQNPSPVGGPVQDTYFPGANSVAAFNSMGGSAYTSQKVPVENTGSTGTINAHWRESVLLNELMTGFLNAGTNPMSILTVRSLQDLGYVVNTATADAFTVSPSLRALVEPGAIMMNDVRAGPIYTVDPAGKLSRIR